LYHFAYQQTWNQDCRNQTSDSRFHGCPLSQPSGFDSHSFQPTTGTLDWVLSLLPPSFDVFVEASLRPMMEQEQLNALPVAHSHLAAN
jgi:hypothetical protein